MKQKRWRGTALFGGVLVVIGLTIGLRMYGGGGVIPAAPVATTSQPTKPRGDSGSSDAQSPFAHPTTHATPGPSGVSGSSGASGISDDSGASGTASASHSNGTPNTHGPSGTPSASAIETIAGAIEETPFGQVQVSITFNGATITAVKELRSPRDERRSEEINSLAAPILAREVVLSQSARVDTVSGATYTSIGYKESAQSAIDKR
jgi:uncharacterized protein with FMN-binding domain